MDAPEASQDGFYLTYGVQKNDFDGLFFSSTPSFLPFCASTPRNAARFMRDLELAAALPAEKRASTPLFGPSPGVEFTRHQLTTALELLLLYGARVAPADLADFSLHCFRIFAACALLAAGVSRPVIKRQLRWRGDESLEIYARLNDSEWRANVIATYTATVDSTVAGRLPSAVGPIDVDLAALQPLADAL